MEAEQYCSGDSLVRVSQDGIFVGFNHMVEAHANAVHTSEGSEDNLPCDVNIGDVDLTPTQHKELASLLRRFQDVFCRDQDDLGFTSTIRHSIPTITDQPVCVPHRRVPPHQMKEVKAHLEKLLRQEIIRPSSSPYAAPVVVVREKRWQYPPLCGLEEAK